MRVVWTMVTALLLAGCRRDDRDDDDDDDSGGVDSGAEPATTVAALGPAPWEGLAIETEGPPPEVATAVLATGEQIELVELVDVGHQADVRARWLPAAGSLPVGTHALIALDGEPLPGVHTFTVEPYGRDQAFDAASVAGGAWELSETKPAGILLTLIEQRLVLLVDAVSEAGADFRVIVDGPEGACLALQGTATLSETGELWWSTDALDVYSDPAMLAEAPWIHLGFSGDGQSIAGVEAATRVDTRAMSTWVDEDDDPEFLCVFGEGLGMVCDPCADGLEACLHVGFHHARGARIEPPAWEALPDCEATMREDSWTCSTVAAAVGGGWLIALVAALRRRR